MEESLLDIKSLVFSIAFMLRLYFYFSMLYNRLFINYLATIVINPPIFEVASTLGF